MSGRMRSLRGGRGGGVVDSERQNGLLRRKPMNVIRLKGCIDLRLANVEIVVERETLLTESTDRPDPHQPSILTDQPLPSGWLISISALMSRLVKYVYTVESPMHGRWRTRLRPGATRASTSASVQALHCQAFCKSWCHYAFIVWHSLMLWQMPKQPLATAKRNVFLLCFACKQLLRMYKIPQFTVGCQTLFLYAIPHHDPYPIYMHRPTYHTIL